MEQKTLEDYFPSESTFFTKSRSNNSGSTSNHSKKTLNSREELTKNKLIQKDLTTILLERERIKVLRNNLGNNWKKKEGGFGYTDEKEIMLFDTIKNFENNFFRVYNKSNFQKIKKREFSMDNSEFYAINGVKYNTYYLDKGLQILRENFYVYQHKKLKLLLLRNSEFAVLLCPRF